MGARYRKIDPRVWADEGFRKLLPFEKLIAFYIITAQSNRAGIFNFSPGRACEDISITQKTFMKSFKRVCEILSWDFDEKARVVFIPTWWKYNSPANPNTLKSCLSD